MCVLLVGDSVPVRSPMETDEEEEDEDDIMVMPKRKRRGDTMAKRQREATPEKKKVEEPKAPSVSAGRWRLESTHGGTAVSGLFGEDDEEEKETGERPGDGRLGLSTIFGVITVGLSTSIRIGGQLRLSWSCWCFRKFQS